MKKIIHTIIIILVVFSLVVETYCFIFTDTGLSNLPASTFNRIIYYYSYFTVLSNIAVGLGSFFILKNANNQSLAFKILRLDSIVCISITALVYNIVLRNAYPPKGIMIITNELLHVIVPLLGLLAWVVYEKRPGIDLKTIALSIIPPFCYVVYVLIRGAVTCMYPYPFLDVNAIGVNQVLINIGIISLIFLILECIFFAIDRKLSKINRG